MKRIIIPAGTVSETEDYILEIPADSNNADVVEDAIYVLQEGGSLTSLSDCFYDLNDGNQNNELYANLSPGPHNFAQSSSLAQLHQRENSAVGMSNLSQRNKYHYYKSLGFTESELYRLLASARAEGNIRKPVKIYPRKQIKFNRLAVSDFLSPTDNGLLRPYRRDSLANPNNFPSNNANVGTYDNMTSVATGGSWNTPYNTSFMPSNYNTQNLLRPRLTESITPITRHMENIRARSSSRSNSPTREISPTKTNSPPNQNRIGSSIRSNSPAREVGVSKVYSPTNHARLHGTHPYFENRQSANPQPNSPYYQTKYYPKVSEAGTRVTNQTRQRISNSNIENLNTTRLENCRIPMKPTQQQNMQHSPCRQIQNDNTTYSYLNEQFQANPEGIQRIPTRISRQSMLPKKFNAKNPEYDNTD